MLDVLTYGMVYLGAALMVYNVYCFFRFARFIQNREKREGEGSELHERNGILYVPTVLLVLFLIGYVLVGLFGNPDLLVGGIFFGGSIFVFIMYKLMESVTQRVIRSEQAEAKLKAVEASDQAKTDFLATISHEMRTPMNVILGLDSMALKDPDLSPETRSQLEKIGHNARHLLDLVNNVLDVHRAHPLAHLRRASAARWAIRRRRRRHPGGQARPHCRGRGGQRRDRGRSA